ncbi:MAG: 16S rRNA (cytidine(1402)-2'-O)-methyltransferase [Candidatus Omnitrophota bacterium]
MLYIVSTPIGNLQDITLRAIDTLKLVDIVAAEDTRHTKILLDHYEIKKPITSFFDHNQKVKGLYLLGLLKEGKSVGLVTDAGTPGISDPGYSLIRLAYDNNIPVTVIPGVTALITALTLSGLPSHRFVFEGFLPPKTVGRCKKLESFKNEEGTIIFYESPHRVLKTLEDIKNVFSDPYLVVARELTKKFEEVKKGKASDLIVHFEASSPRGEFVLLINLSQAENLKDSGSVSR